MTHTHDLKLLNAKPKTEYFQPQGWKYSQQKLEFFNEAGSYTLNPFQLSAEQTMVGTLLTIVCCVNKSLICQINSFVTLAGSVLLTSNGILHLNDFKPEGRLIEMKLTVFLKRIQLPPIYNSKDNPDDDITVTYKVNSLLNEATTKVEPFYTLAESPLLNLGSPARVLNSNKKILF